MFLVLFVFTVPTNDNSGCCCIQAQVNIAVITIVSREFYHTMNGFTRREDTERRHSVPRNVRHREERR